jgi:hypothetical protein
MDGVGVIAEQVANSTASGEERLDKEVVGAEGANLMK